jgi:hypothetical protein
MWREVVFSFSETNDINALKMLSKFSEPINEKPKDWVVFIDSLCRYEKLHTT